MWVVARARWETDWSMRMPFMSNYCVGVGITVPLVLNAARSVRPRSLKRPHTWASSQDTLTVSPGLSSRWNSSVLRLTLWILRPRILDHLRAVRCTCTETVV
jgi:hypothetical protein